LDYLLLGRGVVFGFIVGALFYSIRLFYLIIVPAIREAVDGNFEYRTFGPYFLFFLIGLGAAIYILAGYLHREYVPYLTDLWTTPY